jgi:hypothetical protein
VKEYFYSPAELINIYVNNKNETDFMKRLLLNKKTNEKTYMKMRELHPGFGFGGQHFKTLFIFDTKEAFESFIESGWEFGGNILATSNITSKEILDDEIFYNKNKTEIDFLTDYQNYSKEQAIQIQKNLVNTL